MNALRYTTRLGCAAVVLLAPLVALAARKPPAISVRLLPAPTTVACGPAARPCYAAAVIEIRNQGTQALLFDSVELFGPIERRTRVVEQPERLAPNDRYVTPTPFEVHVAATYRARVTVRVAREKNRVEAAGEKPKREVVDAPLDPGLAAAAVARCIRCSGSSSAGTGAAAARDAGAAIQATAASCACATSDAGRRCTDAADCQGVCLFERIEVQPPPACKDRPGVRCPKVPPMGVKVGRCSERRVPVGCVMVIPHRKERGTPELLPVGQNEKCPD